MIPNLPGAAQAYTRHLSICIYESIHLSVLYLLIFSKGVPTRSDRTLF